MGGGLGPQICPIASKHAKHVWLTLVLPQLFSQQAVLASVVRPFTASNALPFIRWLCHPPHFRGLQQKQIKDLGALGAAGIT